MSVWLNNTTRAHKHNEVEKPCHLCGFCPYGQLVEEFPLHETARAYAVEHGKYVQWVDGSGWVECSEDDEGASPDLNWAVPKVTDPYSCLVFGHDCPVYYHAEGLAEEIVEDEVTVIGLIQRLGEVVGRFGNMPVKVEVFKAGPDGVQTDYEVSSVMEHPLVEFEENDKAFDAEGNEIEQVEYAVITLAEDLEAPGEE